MIQKPSFASLEFTELIEKMKDIQSIELVGICTDICVILSAITLEAKITEIPILVDVSCCAGTSLESRENALNAMKMCNNRRKRR